MRRIFYLAVVCLIAVLIPAEVALADGTSEALGTTVAPGEKVAAEVREQRLAFRGGGQRLELCRRCRARPSLELCRRPRAMRCPERRPRAMRMPATGGPSVLLPAAVLLVGSGVLTLAVLRRSR